VAHSLSAKKRVRQNTKRKAVNRLRKSKVKSAIKGFNAAAEAGDADASRDRFREAVRNLDRVAAAGTIHKRTAARRKSRLARQLNKTIQKTG
jgi:small subunit ribosomal protein S20